MQKGRFNRSAPSRHTSFLVPHIQFVVANDTQSVATPLVTTSDRLHPHTSRLRQLSRPSAVVVTPIREQRYTRLDVGHFGASRAVNRRLEYAGIIGGIAEPCHTEIQ